MFRLDLLGTLLSFISTYYFVTANGKTWPIGIAAIVVNIILYWQAGIYASIGLKIIYLILSIYGWYLWRSNGNKNPLAITSLTMWHKKLLPIIFILLFVTIFHLLKNYTNSTILYTEALAVSVSLIAEWLSCKKKIECWTAWFVADAIFIYIMLYKSLYCHAVLYTVYLAMAIIGFINWRKIQQ
ncbi:MAG: hypothetical protein COC15_04760 [Legionellales bacterium]|nr:MAG: hypothetical protein COC15_04760 [Legionellales bacterium]